MDHEIIKHTRKHSKKRSNKNKKCSNHNEIREYEKYKNNPGENISKIVEYSDVSSEDFSAPEAGEIQTEDSDADFFGNKVHSNNARLVNTGTYQSSSSKCNVTPPISNRLKFHQTGIRISTSPKKRDVLSPDIFFDDFMISEDDCKRMKKKKDKHKHKKSKKAKKKKKKRAKSQESTVESISDTDSIFEGINLTPPIKSPSMSNLVKETSPVSQSKLLFFMLFI